MPAFTVLIPTHDHADTLRYAVRSVQWQTCKSFELFIVGDGVPDRTRAIAAALMAEDSRIRFFDFPKGARHGEQYRHEVLAQATGEFVCYQADDDLWFPEHLDSMAALLRDHDLAHCMQIEIGTEGQVSSWMFDASADPRALPKMRQSRTGFGLNSGGHRLDAYRRLPLGWHPAPTGINTDLHFWLQFLEQPWCRYVSYKWPEVVHLSTVPRKDWDMARRVEELSAWWERIQTAAQREALARTCLLPLHDALLRDTFQSTSDAALVREIRRLADAVTIPLRSESGLEQYAPGEELRFCTGGSAGRFVLIGFSVAEPWGRWTQGEAASIVLPLRAPVATGLTLDVDIMPFLHGELHPVCSFAISVNGSAMVQVDETRPAINRYTVRIPREVIGESTVLVIDIATTAPVRPVDLGMSSDDRLLGVGMVSLTLAGAA